MHCTIDGRLLYDMRSGQTLTAARCRTKPNSLGENGQIHGDLQSSANTKLDWRLFGKEIQRFEGVAGEPQKNHYSTHSKSRFGDVIIVELWNAQHSFNEQRCESKRLDENNVSDQEIC